MKRYLALIVALAIAIGSDLAQASAQTANPFANADWLQVLLHDPKLRDKPQEARYGGHFFEPKTNDAGGGMFMGPRSVSVGQVNGKWVAAIPLNGGGMGGVFSVITYTEDSPTTYARIFDESPSGMGNFGAQIDARGLVLLQPHLLPGMCRACVTQDEETIYTYRDGQFVQTGSDLVDLPKRRPAVAATALKAAHATSVPVRSYAEFNAWFLQQPGSRLVHLKAPRNMPPRQAATEQIVHVEDDMKHFMGPAQSSIGGYYDTFTGIAIISVGDDTYFDSVATTTTSAPRGLPMMHLQPSSGTAHGANIGMAPNQIEAIEGPSRRVTLPNGDVMLAYEWLDGAAPRHLRFLIHAGQCVAVDYGMGAPEIHIPH